jgi:ribosome assembly protein SQT1
MQVFYSHTEPCTAGLFTPSGKLLVTTSADQSLCVWDPRESTPLLKLAPNATAGYGHFSAEGEGGITALAVAPASNLIAIGGANGAIRVINLPNGNVVGQLRGHKQGESVESLQFMDILGLAGPGGEGSGTKGLVLVSCGTDNRAIVWDVTTGNARAEVSHEVSSDSSPYSSGAALTPVRPRPRMSSPPSHLTQRPTATFSPAVQPTASFALGTQEQALSSQNTKVTQA